MAAIITLGDGRQFTGANLGISGMLALISTEVSELHQDLKSWLIKKSDLPAPYLDFDIRGLSSDHQNEFWAAARRALEKGEY